MKKRLSIDKYKILTPLVSLFTMIMLVSVGFAAWSIGDSSSGAIPNNMQVASTRNGAVDYNIVSDGNQDYIDMRFTKQFSKSGFTSLAVDQQNNITNVEYIKADLKWKNVDSSYNDDVSEYFYLTDNDNPMGRNAPQLYNHETGDTVQFDKEQRIYRDTNTFTSMLAYGPNHQKFDTSCTPDWSSFEPVYDTTYENNYADGGSSASSYGGEWITVGTNITGSTFPWCRVDLRCLQKNNKYYFFIFYVFHYTTSHPYSQGRVCRYRGNALTTFSTQSLDQLSYLNYISSYTSGSTTYTSGLVNHDTNKYTAKYLRICYSYQRTSSASVSNTNIALYPCTPYGDNGVTYSSNAYVYDTSASVNLTNPANYANINNRAIYREIDFTMPIVCNAWPYNVTSSDIKWSYAYSYYVKHVEAAVSRTGTGSISTPLNCEFDHFELVYANQYQYTASAKFYFTNTSTGETVVKTVNENISTRGRNFYYKLINRVKENTLTFDYYVRLRPKNDTVKANLENYLKAYTYTFNIEIITTEISTYSRSV